jgi:hypothetical protein
VQRTSRGEEERLRAKVSSLERERDELTNRLADATRRLNTLQLDAVAGRPTSNADRDKVCYSHVCLLSADCLYLLLILGLLALF